MIFPWACLSALWAAVGFGIWADICSVPYAQAYCTDRPRRLVREAACFSTVVVDVVRHTCPLEGDDSRLCLTEHARIQDAVVRGSEVGLEFRGLGARLDTVNHALHRVVRCCYVSEHGVVLAGELDVREFPKYVGRLGVRCADNRNVLGEVGTHEEAVFGTARVVVAGECNPLSYVMGFPLTEVQSLAWSQNHFVILPRKRGWSSSL